MKVANMNQHDLFLKNSNQLSFPRLQRKRKKFYGSKPYQNDYWRVH